MSEKKELPRASNPAGSAHTCVLLDKPRRRRKKKEKGPRADFTLHVETNRLPILDSYLDFPMRTFDRES
jgi:hypothetical protein